MKKKQLDSKIFFTGFYSAELSQHIESVYCLLQKNGAVKEPFMMILHGVFFFSVKVINFGLSDE